MLCEGVFYWFLIRHAHVVIKLISVSVFGDTNHIFSGESSGRKPFAGKGFRASPCEPPVYKGFRAVSQGVYSKVNAPFNSTRCRRSVIGCSSKYESPLRT